MLLSQNEQFGLFLALNSRTSCRRRLKATTLCDILYFLGRKILFKSRKSQGILNSVVLETVLFKSIHVLKKLSHGNFELF